MNKNQIFIKTGTEYKKITKELLEESNLAELIGDKDKMVGIKPNMVSASDRPMVQRRIQRSSLESLNTSRNTVFAG